LVAATGRAGGVAAVLQPHFGIEVVAQRDVGRIAFQQKIGAVLPFRAKVSVRKGGMPPFDSERVYLFLQASA
jgi:hypothetical protein